MKKVSLLSLLAVLAISSAANANVEDPLYAPAEGRLYSKTEVNKVDSAYNFSEEIGYGITNRFFMAAKIDYQNDTDSDADGLDSWKIGGKYRLSSGKAITNLYVDYTKGFGEDNLMPDDAYILDAGFQIGTRTTKYQLAANVGLNRVDNDVADSNNVAFGVKGAYNFDDRVSGSLAFDYILNDDFNAETDEDDSLSMTAQINYQKGGLWSLYYKTELSADVEDENMFGFKYGVQF